MCAQMWPAVTLQGIWSEMKARVHTSTCTYILKTALFISMRYCKQPQSPSMYEQINVLREIYAQSLSEKRNQLSVQAATLMALKCVIAEWQRPDLQAAQFQLCDILEMTETIGTKNGSVTARGEGWEGWSQKGSFRDNFVVTGLL